MAKPRGVLEPDVSAALVSALARGLSVTEAAERVGLHESAVWERLADPAFFGQVDLSRPPCQVCRGDGVCGCSGCRARRAEPRYSVVVRYPALHVEQREGRTCHNCWGSGRSPFVPRSRRRDVPGWQRLRKAVIDEWVASEGLVCPGFDRPRHEVRRSELTVDHIKAVANGGSLLKRSNLRVLCRSCNSRRNSGGHTDTGPSASVDPSARATAIERGARLRRTRERLGISLPVLGTAAGFSVGLVKAVEDGEIPAERRYLRRLEECVTWMRRRHTRDEVDSVIEQLRRVAQTIDAVRAVVCLSRWTFDDSDHVPDVQFVVLGIEPRRLCEDLDWPSLVGDAERVPPPTPEGDECWLRTGFGVLVRIGFFDVEWASRAVSSHTRGLLGALTDPSVYDPDGLLERHAQAVRAYEDQLRLRWREQLLAHESREPRSGRAGVAPSPRASPPNRV